MNYNPANYPWATVKYWSVCIHLSILFGSIYIIIVCLFIFFRKHSHVQLCAELQGSVPCPAPKAAACPPHGLQTSRQGPLDLTPPHGSQWRLQSAPAAQSGEGGYLWRRNCGIFCCLPPGQTRLDWHCAPGAGQVRQNVKVSPFWHLLTYPDHLNVIKPVFKLYGQQNQEDF